MDRPRKYKCVICGDSFNSQKEAWECEWGCNFVIECYMFAHDVDYEKAKKIFLMERI